MVVRPEKGLTPYYSPTQSVTWTTWFGSQIKQMTDGSGLMYMRNRYYSPEPGTFTQSDPIGLAGGINAYGFANGDPVSYSDPYGLCPPGMSPSECAEYVAGLGDLRAWVTEQAHSVQQELAQLGRSWSAQRQAFWRTVSRDAEAVKNWSEENVARMRTGRAPRLPNLKGESKSVELSHEPVPQREGGTEVVPRTPEQHARVDPFRRLGGAESDGMPFRSPEIPLEEELPIGDLPIF